VPDELSVRKRIFTLREAQQLLPEVQAITSAAEEQAGELAQALDDMPPGVEREQLRNEYEAVLQDWVGRILDLGCEVKGLWLVDFDSGDGIYYCWQHPESGLEFFHDYDGGFAARRPLGPMHLS
jgi:hypothetical protein